jgi:hypothetical protein
VTRTHGVLSRFKSLWLSSWPLWALIVFASLAAVRLLPAGYIRAIVAAPILLSVPGSLTIGATFSRRPRPQGTAFICYAALLSALWSAFASLALYVGGVLISAESTYWCLLIISAALAIVAEARLLLGGQGRGRRVANRPGALDPDLSDSEVKDAKTPTKTGGEGRYAILAVVAGISLLAGGLYAYDHIPHPVTGYTFIAWTASPSTGEFAVGSSGTELHFQIVHRESDTTTYRLSAAWLGTLSWPLAKSLTLSIGPNRTFRGGIFVPPLPDGCTYRIVVTLSAIQQIDPLTRKLETWSINADVHDPDKSSKTCNR